MKTIFTLFLLIITLTAGAQTDNAGVSHQNAAIAPNSLYCAYTPDGDAFKDSAYTYFLFLPERKLLWFLSSRPPQQQNLDNIAGIIGTYSYNYQNDTLKFYGWFYDPAYHQSIGDLFTCTLSNDTLNANLEERLFKGAVGTTLHYVFKLCPGH